MLLALVGAVAIAAAVLQNLHAPSGCGQIPVVVVIDSDRQMPGINQENFSNEKIEALAE